MAITIDSTNRRLILDSTSVTAQAIYAAWADWMLLEDNVKFLPAFGSAGGEDLGSGLLIPAYYFLENGWRVRPMEANQNLTITGNLFVRGGGVPVVPTLGIFQVNVNYTVPVQAQGIATNGASGPSAAAIAAEVLAVIELSAILGKEATVAAIKAKTDLLEFTGTDVKATLDGEAVTTDAASRSASKAKATIPL